MALAYGSSKTNPNYANYSGTLKPMSSQTNSTAANYQGRLTSGVPTPNVLLGGQVLGASVGAAPGPGPAPTNNVQQTQQTQQGQQAGGPDLGVFDQLIAPIVQDLEGQIAPAQGFTNEMIGNIQSQGQTNLSKNQTSLQGTTNELQQRMTGAKDLAGNAVNEARRGFSEMAQGIQSRYGGSTGTGAFAEAILGGQTQKNIASYRNKLAQDIATIQDTMGQVKLLAEDQARVIEDTTNQRILQAKQDLQNTINDIRGKIGVLQSQKAQWTKDAILSFQQGVQQAQQLQQKFQNDLATKQQEADLALRNAWANKKQEVAKLTLNTDAFGNLIAFNNNNVDVGGFKPYTGGTVVQTGGGFQIPGAVNQDITQGTDDSNLEELTRKYSTGD